MALLLLDAMGGEDDRPAYGLSGEDLLLIGKVCVGDDDADMGVQSIVQADVGSMRGSKSCLMHV